MQTKIEPITDIPSTEEMSLRMNKVKKLMEKHQLDYYVTAHTDNVYYLSNFAYYPLERPFFLIIPLEGKPMFVVPLLEVSHAEQRNLIDSEYHTYYEYPAPAGKTFADAMAKLITSDKKVGIESSLSYALQQAVPGKISVVDIVDEARLVKTDYEVGRIVYACSVVELGLKKVLELSQPGAAMATLYSEGSKEMMVKTLFEIPNVNMLVTKFLAAVWPKAISAQPHAVPGLFDGLEKGGPNVAIITAQTNGYSAELERTFFLGEVPDESRKLFDLSMKARQKAYDIIKPGMRGDEIDDTVLNVIKEAGYEKNILHRTGHGFGITGHEPPWIALGSEHVMEKNMVISIEPGIYVEGLGGFRHSDTVLVTEDGCLPLTNYADTLEDLVLPIEPTA